MTLDDFDPATFDRWSFFGAELLAWTGARWEHALYLRPAPTKGGIARAWVLLDPRELVAPTTVIASERKPKILPRTQLHVLEGPRRWIPSWDLDAPAGDTDDPAVLAKRARQNAYTARGARGGRT